jgi:ribosome-associated protein
MKEIGISTEYITLGQFLKLADCIDTGGQAKPFLAEYAVYVNGEKENKRGKKLYKNDIIAVEGCGKFKITAR